MHNPRSADIVLTADDPDAAASVITDEYSEVTIKAPGSAPFAMRLEAFVLPHVRYGELTFSESSVRTRTYPSYTLCLPTAGSLVATATDTADVVCGTDGAVISPGSRVDARYLRDGIALRTVHFDIDIALHELSALLGRTVATPPRFKFALPSDVDAGAIGRAVAVLDAELRTGSPLVQSPVLADRLSSVILSSLLLNQPHTYSEELRDRARTEGPRAIRTLLARIEADPMAFTTVGDLAAAAGLSVRALQEGFRRHVGTSPMGYLRQARLDKAHEALRDGDSSATTAAAIARRWGFAHYSRFAADYRARFGVAPAHTLKHQPSQNPR